MKLRTIITLLVTLIILFTFLDLVKTGNPVSNLDILDGIQEWEKYKLDEEANKDKLYCRITEDENGNVIETRWYNSFINPNDVVRTDNGDTKTENCEWPQHEPVYAVGSNEGKVYSRTLKDIRGNIIETMWYDACSDKLIRTDEGDTTYSGSNEFTGECYHPDYATGNNGETVLNNEEFDVKENPLYETGSKVISWLKNLFNV